ncbi:hypothetical protein HN747_02165 [archaeon]|jgi:hypothetical protein|nr:hypothetical protein [archaeon]
MESKSLHLSISQEDYLSNKKNVLGIQADLIALMEKVSILKDIRSRKALIYRALSSEYNSLLKDFSKFKKTLPEVKVSRASVREDINSPDAEFESKASNMQSELLEIQAKLERLNALG